MGETRRPPYEMTALEEKLLRAMRAAEDAFEAGYPAKARSIVQGALRLVEERDRLRREGGEAIGN